ncbi:MAG: oligosaccharide repeat unit polymerase [Alicyclobacillus sp.]|nr:oligosaccharide repeat unit polymerase [Alicyclobacillus sp.]
MAGVWALVFSELVGVFPRAYVLQAGLDTFIGPGASAWIPKALEVILLYNVAFVASFALASLILNVGKPRDCERCPAYNTDLASANTIDRRSLLIALVLCAVVGLLVWVASSRGTVFSSEDIALLRTETQGLGPQIMLSEVPLMALVVWYSVCKGEVTWKWWIITAVIFGLSLSGGSRSQVLDFSIVLFTVHAMRRGIKLRPRSILALLGVAFILTYAAWAVEFGRGMMQKFGGSFFKWAFISIRESPLPVYIHLLRHSFNGFDGLVAVVGIVPGGFPYHPGLLLYQSLTAIIPRAIWPSKWSVDLVSAFTHAAFGWSTGGNFVTGAGAAYLDSGWVGTLVAGAFLGASTVLICDRWRKTQNTDSSFTSVVRATWCFFVARFTFAGASTDFMFAERMLLEMLLIYCVYKLVRGMARRHNANRDNIKGMNRYPDNLSL